MSKYGGNNRIDFGVHFNTDKSSLEQVKKSLQEIQNIKPSQFKGTVNELKEIQNVAKQLEGALQKAFNVKLNTVNIEQFKKELNAVGMNLNSAYNTLSGLGAKGRSAFNQMNASLLTTNTQLRESAGLLHSMGLTMMNTAKWGIASRVMNGFTQSISLAFHYVKSLDSALTDIRIVTGDSTEKMSQFADQANRAAQLLGRSTMDYSKAALTFYQQGLSDEDVAARTEATLKAQNITGAGLEMADYLTAVWNGYKVANEEAELYVDKLAAVADSSASNMSLLATAMSKVASTANLLGVPVDSLNAQIATIEATTRQAPETVGNALKTIYARINDIKTGSEDAEVSLGNYTKQMAKVGISVLDVNGQLRDTGDVIELIGGKWEDLSREQQIYLARTMAGQRQYNNLLALFENWSKYTDLLNVSMTAQGTTMEKNSRYMDSLAAHMEQLGAAGERVKSAMIDSESFKGLIDVGTNLTLLLANFIESIGGGGTALLGLGSIATQVFSGMIAREIGNAIIKARENNQVYLDMRQKMQLVNSMKNDAAYQDPNNQAWREYVDNLRLVHQSWTVLTQDERNLQQARIQKIQDLANEKAEYKLATLVAEKFYNVFSNGKTLDMVSSEKASAQLQAKFIPALQLAKLNWENLEIAIAADEGNEELAINKLIESLISLGEASNDSESLAFDFAEALIKTKELADYTGNAYDELSDSIKQYLGLTDKIVSDVQGYETKKQKISELTQETQKYSAEMQKVNKESQTVYQAQNITRTISAVGQLASGIMSLTNLFRVLKNDSLSGGEKILQIVTNLGFTIPMLVNSFRQIQHALGMEVTILDKVLIKEKLRTKEIEKQNLLRKQEQLNNIFGGADPSRQVQAELDKVGDALKRNQALTDILNGKLLSFGEGGKAAIGKIVSGLKTIGPWALAIGAIIGGIVLTYRAYTKDARAAAQAAKLVGLAKLHYEKVKQSTELLKSSIDKITQAQNALNNSIKGTLEWNTALQECNSTVLELIRNYPKLALYVTNVNGQLQLSEEGKEEALNIVDKNLSAANYAVQSTSRNAREANITADATTLGRGAGSTYGARGEVRARDIQSEEVKEIINTLIRVEDGFTSFDASSQELSEYISEQTGITKQTIDAILSSEDKVAKLELAVRENTTATKLENEARAADLMKDENYYKNAAEEDKKILNTLGAGIVALEEEYWKGLIDKPSRRKDADDYNWGDLVLAEMSKATGQTLRWANNSITGGANNRQLQFQAEGSDDIIKYSDEYVASIMAATSALDKLGDKVPEVLNKLNAVTFKDLDQITTEHLQEGIKGFITGLGMGNLSQSELNILKKTNVDEAFGGSDNLIQIAKSMDIMPSELRKQFSEMIEGTEQDFVKMFQGLPVKVKNSVQDISKNIKGFDNLSKDALQGIINSLKTAFNTGGSEGLTIMQDTLSSLNLNLKDLNSLGTILGQIDWTDSAAVGELNQKIEEQGININTASSLWQAFTAYIENVTNKLHNASEAFDQVKNSLASLRDVKDLLPGKLLSTEDYDELIAKNKELANAFQLTADGYVFIGSQEDVLNILKSRVQTTIDDFHNMKKAAEDIVNDTKTSANVDLLSKFNFNDKKISSVYSIQEAFSKDLKLNNALGALGLDQESFNDALSWLESHAGLSIKKLSDDDKALYEANKEKVLLYLNAINQLKADYNDDKFTDNNMRNLIAGLAAVEGLQTLKLYYDEGTILALNYVKVRDAALSKLLERLNVTKELYENTADVVEDQLNNVSDSFKKLDKDAQKVLIDQLTSQVIEAGLALDEIGAISKDTLDLLQGLGELELGSNDLFIKLKENLLTIFDTNIDTSFIQEHFDLIRRLAEGDITALNDLQLALGQLFIADIKPQVNSAGAEAELTAFSDYLNNYNFDDLQVGVSLEDSGFFDTLEKFALAAGMSADQINELLAGIGFEPLVTEQSLPFDEDNLSKHDNEYTYTYVDPVTEEKKEIHLTTEQVDQARSGGQVTVPIINGKKIKYKGGSGIGNFSRPNYSKTAAPKSSGSGKGKSGSSSKPKVMKTEKAKLQTLRKLADPDPYYKINTAIAKQNKLLDILDKKESNLSGKERLQNLKKQNDELDKQIDNYEKYLSKSKQEETNTTAGLRKALQQKFNISFDEEGNIVDLNSINQQAINAYNNAIAEADKDLLKARKTYNTYAKKYTKQSASWQEKHDGEKQKVENTYKDAQEAQKKAVLAAKKEYDEKMEYLKKYQDALKNDEKIHEQLLDALRKKILHTFEASKIKVDLSLDSGEFLREWLDFENKVIKKISEDDTFGNALAKFQKLNTYFDNLQLQNTNAELKQLTKDLATMEAGDWAEGYKPSADQLANLSAEEIEALRLQTLQAMRERLKEIQKEQQNALIEMQLLTLLIKKDYVDAINKAIDKWDEHIEQYERINDLVEHNVKLTELLYGEKGYSTLDKYYQLQKKNNYDILNNLQLEKNILENELSRINYSVNPEAWETVKKQLDNVVDSINSKLLDMLDNLAKLFENKLNAAIDRINNKLTDNLGTNYLDEQWDYLNNYDDYFLDTYNATTGIEDVTHAYQQAIDDAATNPKQQQRLNKLMNDQLTILKEKDKLTEYDLDRAKSMLEVEKARMALEDARNNKTKMRLRRDSQGNYTYQYVADEEKLGDLQQALADAQNDLYNTDKEHYKQNLNTLYDTYKEYIEKMKDLTTEYNATQDEEERARIQNRIDLLQLSYSKMYEGLTEDNKYNIQYLTQSYGDGMNIDMSALTTEEQWQVLKENVPWAQSNIQNLADSIIGEGGLLPATKSLVKELSNAIKQYDEDVESILISGGTSLLNITNVTDLQGKALDENITNALKVTKHTKDLVTATQQAVENMEALLKVVDDYWGEHDKQLQSFINTLLSGFNTVMKFDTLTEDENGEATGTRVLKAEDYNNGNYKTTDISSANFTGDIAKDTDLLTALLNQAVAKYGEFLQSMINSSSSYSTGGYTGEWGTEGKLATLHQKELVLNEHDTENILAAVTAIRDATSNMNIQSLLNNLGNSTSNLLKNLIENGALLDQNVHIDANFPNVTQHTLIEEAFNNLVNMAAMRASEYRK